MPTIWNMVWFYRWTPLRVLLFALEQTKQRPFTLVVDSAASDAVPVRAKSRVTFTRVRLDTFKSNIAFALPPCFARVHRLRLHCHDREEWISVSRLLFELDGQGLRRVDAVMSRCESHHAVAYLPNNWCAIAKVNTTSIPLGWGGRHHVRWRHLAFY